MVSVLPLFVVCDSWAGPMGTAFTYQGRLIDANNPADGLYDFLFRLYDANVAGTQKGSAIDVNELDVLDGYFTMAMDFGSGIFDGNDRWLEIGIRTGELKDPNAYTILSPRQQVKGTPYALYAKTAGGGGGSLWQVNGTSIYYNNGNVGIGTANPAQNLEVEGGVFIDHSGGAHVPAEQGIALTVDGRAGKNILRLRDSEANTAMVVNHVGKVGIGTSSPTAKLEVNGQVRITDGTQAAGKVLTSDSVGLASWQSPTETDPTVLASVKDGVSWGEVSGRPAGLDDGDDVGITIESDPTVPAAIKDGISWGEVSGRPAGLDDGDDVGITIESDPKVGSNTTNYVPKWNGLALVTGTIFDNGNVGIGEANPVARLVVGQGGDILLKAAGEDAGDIIFQNSTGTQKGRMWGDPTAGQNMLCLSSADNTADITIDPNGNVGIGTASPTAKLDVNGTIKTAGIYETYMSTNWTAKELNRNWVSVAMSADGTKQTAVVYSGQIYISTNSGNTWTAKESNRYWNSVAMSSDGTKQTAVVQNGQIYINIGYIGVGIGTTNPAGKLDVNGSIYQRGAILHADYVFEPGYKLESIDEHSEFMWQEKHLPAMPKIQKDENGREIVEIGARSRGIVEELEKAHIYIEQLHKNINQLQEQNKKLQDRISAMETITNELAAGQKGGAR